jgi:transketolase
MLNEISAQQRREGVRSGGYVAIRESGELRTIILSCGSELQHAIAAAKQLGDSIRVVSMPCMERFEVQSADYKQQVLPRECRRRVAIEAGVPDPWFRYVGLDGKIIGLTRFGLSGPGAKVMEKLGITAQAVVDAVRSLG